MKRMILIVGGVFQGKLEFAKSLKESGVEPERIVDGENLDEEQLASADVVNHFHLYLRSLLEQGREVTAAVQSLLERNPQVILVAAELGCGVVPVDAFDRQYRETVGRVCCRLAKEAQAVYRVTCGIGVRIK